MHSFLFISAGATSTLIIIINLGQIKLLLLLLWRLNLTLTSVCLRVPCQATIMADAFIIGSVEAGALRALDAWLAASLTIGHKVLQAHACFAFSVILLRHVVIAIAFASPFFSICWADALGGHALGRDFDTLAGEGDHGSDE